MTASNDNAQERFDDVIQPFLIDQTNLHGRFVRLTEVVNTILTRHQYPPAVCDLLAELLTLTALLSRILKDQGILTVQIQGDGPVKLMVADVTHAGEMRGYADIDEAAHAKLDNVDESHLPLNEVIGTGYMVITLDRGGSYQPYQGIVALEGDTLTECCLKYLHESEQFTVHMKTAIERCRIHGPNKKWRASGIMVQRLPEEGQDEHPTLQPRPERDLTALPNDEDDSNVIPLTETPEQAWERTTIFIDTLTNEEMLDPELKPSDLLYRLFHEDGIWAYETDPLSVGCRCQRGKIQQLLEGMSADDLDHMTIDGKITVTCQFCTKDEVFERDSFNA